MVGDGLSFHTVLEYLDAGGIDVDPNARGICLNQSEPKLVLLPDPAHQIPASKWIAEKRRATPLSGTGIFSCTQPGWTSVAPGLVELSMMM